MAIQKGTGFTNLNRILQANKGNKLGSTVSGGIQGQVSGVKTQVKSAQDQFNEEAQKNRLDTQESTDKRNEILNRFAPSTGASGVQTAQAGLAQATPENPDLTKSAPTTASNTSANQTGSPVSDQEIQDFTKYRTGTYTGPKELQDATSLYGKAQQAEQLGGLARSEGGRQELLRRFVGGNNYTSGQKQLDATLLGQKPGQLGSAAREARGSTNLVEGANAQASNIAQEYTNKAKQFGQETTQKIGETKAPLSTDLDTRVKEAQAAEDARLASLKNIQGVLTGGDAYKGLDQWTRSGLALQEAANQGILSQSDIKMLLGSGDNAGLLQRGANLGLDMNALINERLTNTTASNLGRSGLASVDDISKLNALDRLAGKQGTDLEFLEGQGKYGAGKTGFNTGSLEDYISKTESEKARTDKAYADKLAAEQARYMNQSMAGGQQAMGGLVQAAGGYLSPLGVLEKPGNVGEIVGAGAGNIVGGAGNALAGTTSAITQGAAGVLEGLTKLNIGGESIANTEGGRQLLKLIEGYSKLSNTATGNLTNFTGNWGDAIGELGRGNIIGAGGEILNPVQDVLRQIQGGDIGKTATNVGSAVGKGVGDVGKAVGNAVSSITGGGIKISDEDLKTDIDYNPRDVQKFMDRIKPAAYDYKKEVQDSPLASKNRELGVMAQDLEKSKLGKEAVQDTGMGKVVDYDNLEPKMLASIAALNQRLKELETKK